MIRCFGLISILLLAACATLEPTGEQQEIYIIQDAENNTEIIIAQENEPTEDEPIKTEESPAETTPMDINLTLASSLHSVNIVREISLVADEVMSFHGMFARFIYDGKFGLIDINGNVIVPPIYSKIGYFSDGMAWVIKYDKFGYIDHTGELVIPLIFDAYFDNYKWFGEDMCEYVSWNSFNFRDGRALVRVDGKAGFIDKTGVLVIPAIYDALFWHGEWGSYLPRFYNNHVVIRKNGMHGILDRYGNVVMPFEYDRIGDNFDSTFSGFPLRASRGGYWGFVNEYGEEIIPFEFGAAQPFSNGLAAVTKGGWGDNWGFIDTTGELVLPFEFFIGDQWEGWSAFDEHGLLVLPSRDHRNLWGVGLLNRSGEWVLPPEFSSIWVDSEELIIATIRHTELRDSQWGWQYHVTLFNEYFYFDAAGNEIPAPEDDVPQTHWHSEVNRTSLITRNYDGVTLYGMMMDNNLILSIVFHEITWASDTLLWVRRDNLWGLVEIIQD